MIRFNPFAIARLFSWKQQDVFSRLYTYHWVIGCIFLLISHTDASAQGGGLDPLFNPADHGLVTTEGANNDVFAIGVQPDGNILIAGAFTTFNGKPANRIARIWPDGSLDASFNPGGAGADGSVNKIALQADGKIILAGSFTQYNGSPAIRILRLN
ncbi:MAG TPA: delta-60 repeat domain-containing protein, partial [Ferruginibacter sp.]|nr:delta-60 repeat domain-containing protein [Ferruginibacter sp.]